MEVDQFNLFFVYFFLFLSLFWESEFERIRIIVEVLDPDPDGAQWGSSIRIQIIAFLQQWMKVYWICTVGHHFQWIFIETVTFFYFGPIYLRENRTILGTTLAFQPGWFSVLFFLLLGSALLLFIQSDHSFFTMVPPSLLII